MSKKQHGLLLVMAVVAGLASSMVSSWFLRRALLFAQKMPQEAKVTRAEKFEVVDTDGKVRATLGLRKEELALGLLQKDGRIRAVLGLEGDGEPSLKLYDKGETARAALGLWHGEPALSLLYKGGKLRAVVGLGVIAQNIVNNGMLTTSRTL